MTAKRRSKQKALPELSSNQLEIMQVIWESKETTVSEVWESLLLNRQVARNTVLTLMDRLTQKGWLTRRLRDGLHHYSATVARKQTLGDMVNQMVEKAFAGSSEDLVLALLESRGFTKDEHKRIQTLIQKAGKKGTK